MSKRTPNESKSDRVGGNDCEAEVYRVKSLIGVHVRDSIYPHQTFIGSVAQINELINTLTRHMRDANQWEIENAD